MNTGFMDYYEILEVHHNASIDVIKNAYRTLAKKYHPDLSGLSIKESTIKMSLLNEAFDVLSDGNKRAAYDYLWTNHYGLQHEDPSSRNATERTHYDNADDIILREIDEICNRIMEQLDQNISKLESANVLFNKFWCDKALNEFTQVIPHSMEGLNKQSESYRLVEVIVAITLWRMGTSYTWANEFSTASSLLKQALSLAKPSDDFYSRLEKAAIDVEKAANKIIVSEKSSRDWRKFKIAFWAIIIFSGLFVNFLVDRPKSSTKPNPQPVSASPAPNTTASGSNPAKEETLARPQAPAPPPVPLIPKANVVSQYDPKEPKLNMDGYGEITIDNTRNDFPVYVRIWNTDAKPKPVRTFTIRQGESFTTKSINPGTYEIRYATIYENKEASSASKSEPFTMKEKQEPDGIRYSRFSLTLYKVRDGNTQTYAIPMSDL